MCCEKFAANALYNVKCFALPKKRFPRRPTNESFFFKTWLFWHSLFLQNKWGFTTRYCGLCWNQLLHWLLVAFECVSRVECITYCCLCGNEYWNEFSSCGQYLKATFNQRKWPVFKEVCKLQSLRLKEQPTQSSTSLENFFEEQYTHDHEQNTKNKRYSTFKIQEEQPTKFLWKFPNFWWKTKSHFFSHHHSTSFCAKKKKTLSLWTRFNLYRLSVQVPFFVCEKSQLRYKKTGNDIAVPKCYSFQLSI